MIQQELLVYQNDEILSVESHIQKTFGDISAMFQETIGSDVWVDIYVINPTENRNFYTLVTMGMGAYEMTTPLGAEKFKRSELLMTLPPDWDFSESNENSFWPIRWLRAIARAPINENSWLSFGHTIESDHSFSYNTRLSAAILLFPMVSPDIEDYSCQLPNNECVQFYQVVPLYKEELKYCHTHDWEELLDLMCLDDDFSHIVNPTRPNYYETFMP